MTILSYLRILKVLGGGETSITRNLRQSPWCRFILTSHSTLAEQQGPSNNEHISNRRKFKDTPVNPSILRYIRSIGVGIPPRYSKKRAQRHSRLFALESLSEGRRNRSFQRKNNNQSEDERGTNEMWKPPAPFGPESVPVRLMGESFDDENGGAVFPRNKKKISEVALAGRSNVGKSTLLNALLYGNKNKSQMERDRKRGHTPSNVKIPKGIKAVTSPKPGETRRLTFYELASRTREGVPQKKLCLVDLPGYGFAFASEADSECFGGHIVSYLLDRGKALKRILLLIDARHGIKKADADFVDSLQQDVSKRSGKRTLPPIQLVLTKCDLVNQSDLARRIVHVRQELSDILKRETSQLPVMLVSARAGVGYNKLVREKARGGVMELQKELAALAVTSK